jgi:hypothetical protein
MNSVIEWDAHFNSIQPPIHDPKSTDLYVVNHGDVIWDHSRGLLITPGSDSDLIVSVEDVKYSGLLCEAVLRKANRNARRISQKVYESELISKEVNVPIITEHGPFRNIEIHTVKQTISGTRKEVNKKIRDYSAIIRAYNDGEIVRRGINRSYDYMVEVNERMLNRCGGFIFNSITGALARVGELLPVHDYDLSRRKFSAAKGQATKRANRAFNKDVNALSKQVLRSIRYAPSNDGYIASVTNDTDELIIHTNDRTSLNLGYSDVIKNTVPAYPARTIINGFGRQTILDDGKAEPRDYVNISGIYVPKEESLVEYRHPSGKTYTINYEQDSYIDKSGQQQIVNHAQFQATASPEEIKKVYSAINKQTRFSVKDRNVEPIAVNIHGPVMKFAKPEDDRQIISRKGRTNVELEKLSEHAVTSVTEKTNIYVGCGLLNEEIDRLARAIGGPGISDAPEMYAKIEGYSAYSRSEKESYDITRDNITFCSGPITDPKIPPAKNNIEPIIPEVNRKDSEFLYDAAIPENTIAEYHMLNIHEGITPRIAPMLSTPAKEELKQFMDKMILNGVEEFPISISHFSMRAHAEWKLKTSDLGSVNLAEYKQSKMKYIVEKRGHLILPYNEELVNTHQNNTIELEIFASKAREAEKARLEEEARVFEKFAELRRKQFATTTTTTTTTTNKAAGEDPIRLLQPTTPALEEAGQRREALTSGERRNGDEELVPHPQPKPSRHTTDVEHTNNEEIDARETPVPPPAKKRECRIVFIKSSVNNSNNALAKQPTKKELVTDEPEEGRETVLLEKQGQYASFPLFTMDETITALANGEDSIVEHKVETPDNTGYSEPAKKVRTLYPRFGPEKTPEPEPDFFEIEFEGGEKLRIDRDKRFKGYDMPRDLGLKDSILVTKQLTPEMIADAYKSSSDDSEDDAYSSSSSNDDADNDEEEEKETAPVLPEAVYQSLMSKCATVYDIIIPEKTCDDSASESFEEVKISREPDSADSGEESNDEGHIATVSPIDGYAKYRISRRAARRRNYGLINRAIVDQHPIKEYHSSESEDCLVKNHIKNALKAPEAPVDPINLDCENFDYVKAAKLMNVICSKQNIDDYDITKDFTRCDYNSYTGRTVDLNFKPMYLINYALYKNYGYQVLRKKNLLATLGIEQAYESAALGLANLYNREREYVEFLRKSNVLQDQFIQENGSPEWYRKFLAFEDENAAYMYFKVHYKKDYAPGLSQSVITYTMNTRRGGRDYEYSKYADMKLFDPEDGSLLADEDAFQEKYAELSDYVSPSLYEELCEWLEEPYEACYYYPRFKYTIQELNMRTQLWNAFFMVNGIPEDDAEEVISHKELKCFKREIFEVTDDASEFGMMQYHTKIYTKVLNYHLESRSGKKTSNNQRIDDISSELTKRIVFSYPLFFADVKRLWSLVDDETDVEDEALESVAAAALSDDPRLNLIFYTANLKVMFIRMVYLVSEIENKSIQELDCISDYAKQEFASGALSRKLLLTNIGRLEYLA